MVTLSPLFTVVLCPLSEAESTSFNVIIKLSLCKRRGSAEIVVKKSNISETDALGRSRFTAGLPTAFFAPPRSLIVIILPLLRRFLPQQPPLKPFLVQLAFANAR